METNQTSNLAVFISFPKEILGLIISQFSNRDFRFFALQSLLQCSQEYNTKFRPFVKYANINALVKV